MGNASSVQDIKLGDKIGDGLYGEVFKAVWRGKQVAAKRICAVFFDGDECSRAAFLERFKSEWELLSNLKHPNIVQFYTVILHPLPETPIIVTELLVCDLAKHIRDSRSKPKVSFSEVVKIMLDVAEALHHLHSQKPPIVHRDLSSKNVLLTKSLHAKIAGFGLAKVFPHGAMCATPMPGTPVYAAPETYPKKMGRTRKGYIAIYSEKIDIHSFGALMLETIIGHLPNRILRDPVLEGQYFVSRFSIRHAFNLDFNYRIDRLQVGKYRFDCFFLVPLLSHKALQFVVGRLFYGSLNDVNVIKLASHTLGLLKKSSTSD